MCTTVWDSAYQGINKWSRCRLTKNVNTFGSTRLLQTLWAVYRKKRDLHKTFYSRQPKKGKITFGGSVDVLCERMVGCLENEPKWCSISVLKLRLWTWSLSIFKDPGYSKRTDIMCRVTFLQAFTECTPIALPLLDDQCVCNTKNLHYGMVTIHSYGKMASKL